MREKTSRLPGFYKLPVEERVRIIKQFADLTDEEVNLLLKTGALSLELADKMVENVVGTMELPLGVAVNFLINGKDYVIPMATEEPSVIAAASNMAKVARENGGINAWASDPIMIGQIHMDGVEDFDKAKEIILSNKNYLLELAKEQDPSLVNYGGGPIDIEVRKTRHEDGEEFLVVHLLVNCADAMGANIVNTMVEVVADHIEKLVGGKAYLKIISNLAVHRIARAEVRIKPETIGGENVVEGIVKASKMAEADIFRATTHNKGIMNGITAVALATGNDTRAIEAGCHAYACKDGSYKPLAIWRKDEKGNLVGKIEVPISAGVVGGATRVHPLAKISLKILNVSSAKELAMVMASVGLIQNLAAIRAITTEGIQRGHMELHARNLAIMAGAKEDEAVKVAELAVKLAKEKGKKVNMEIVKEALELL